MDIRVVPTIEQQSIAIYEAVLHAGEPVLLTSIYQYIREAYPALKWNRLIIHMALLKDIRIGHFLNSGNEWYDVKQFEEDWKHKKEKIHSMVLNFIKKQAGPVHLSAIVNYISPYHQTDEATLKRIIKIDLRGICVPLSGGYYEIRVGGLRKSMRSCMPTGKMRQWGSR